LILIKKIKIKIKRELQKMFPNLMLLNGESLRTFLVPGSFEEDEQDLPPIKPSFYPSTIATVVEPFVTRFLLTTSLALVQFVCLGRSTATSCFKVL